MLKIFRNKEANLIEYFSILVQKYQSICMLPFFLIFLAEKNIPSESAEKAGKILTNLT